MKWHVWAALVQKVIQAYAPGVLITVESIDDDAPQWNFSPAYGYQSALLGVFCSVLKHLHLYQYHPRKKQTIPR